MGGDAGMHSEPGNGSTFWLTARLKRTDRTDEPLAPADIPDDDDDDPLAQLQQHFGGLHVLVVDQDPVNRDFACFALEDAGMSHDLAGSADEALTLARARPCGLVLLALDLGTEDGVGIAQALRRLPGMADVPILAMSSGPAANEQLRCHDAGLAGPVAKPVTPDTLGPHILRCLRRR
jgi:CheY-like chemotaxis protein